jgi:hypothetical protein
MNIYVVSLYGTAYTYTSWNPDRTNQFGSGSYFGLIEDPDPEHELHIDLYIISRVDPPADELVQRHRYA